MRAASCPLGPDRTLVGQRPPGEETHFVARVAPSRGNRRLVRCPLLRQEPLDGRAERGVLPLALPPVPDSPLPIDQYAHRNLVNVAVRLLDRIGRERLPVGEAMLSAPAAQPRRAMILGDGGA